MRRDARARTGWLLLTIVALAAAGAGCGPILPTTPTAPVVGSPATPKGPLMAEFDANLAKWRAAGISRYAFRYTPSCFCPLTAHLVVADAGQIRIDGEAMDGSVAPPIGAPLGVDGLFAEVRRAIGGDVTTVVYDGATGVPISLDSDPMANAIDDEHTFQVTEWTLDPVDDGRLGEITRARRVWDAGRISSYDWSLSIDGTRYDIRVRDGMPTVRTGGRTLKDALDGPYTVSSFFDGAVFSAMTRGIDLEIAFDPRRGYPTAMTWHDSRPDGSGSGTIRVLAFEVVPSGS